MSSTAKFPTYAPMAGGRLALAAALLCALSCKAGPGPENAGDATAQDAPVGRLPRTVLPRAYTLELTVLPERERFLGRTQIVVDLREPSQRIWLHGRGLDVKRVSASQGETAWAGQYAQFNEDGLASITFDAPLPAGRATLVFEYEAPFDRTLKGLYRVDVDADHYAFTQFEPYSARLAFPSFDEPSFKTPFDVWLTVANGNTAIANTRELARSELGDGYTRIQFARTEPLPTYLVALAVGPLDVVEAADIPPSGPRTHPIPFRGVAVKGRGDQLAYALARTPALVQALEAYFDIPYPYDKLDVIAVPDFAAGAMENAGAITFREWLLLLDPDEASEFQRRMFSYVMSHELAHQWFGNLVTMPWWDDIWLNEAFATWMGYRAIDDVWPDQNAGLSLLEQVHGAMSEDSMISARMIRQPIESTHDINSAFDSITYRKGGGVLAMFERYVGADTFRAGIRAHLRGHAFGNADADDLLRALSDAADQDIATPFKTFLEQAGVPELQVTVQCSENGAHLSLSQRRYLPIGSTGSRDQTWQLPVCVRYGLPDGTTQSQCTLLTTATGDLSLAGGCPTWVMPNADAAGYYLWSLSSDALGKLTEAGFAQLSTRERMSLARSLRAGLDAGSIQADAALRALPALASAQARPVVEAPMSILWFLFDHVVDPAQRAAVSAYARELYQPVDKRLGRKPKPGEDGETGMLRASVLGLLADLGQDASVRKDLARLGRKYLGTQQAMDKDAVPTDLAALAVRVALQDGDDALFDLAYHHLVRTEEPAARDLLLTALSSVHDERSQRALSLTLDPALRVNEVTRPLSRQVHDYRTRKAAWDYLAANFDAIAARLSARAMGYTVFLARSFCGHAQAEAVQALFGPRAEHMDAGPRNLALTLEDLELCGAQAAHLKPAAEAFFEARQ